MVVSNLVFDVVLFGALLLAALLDGYFPAGAGVATLLIAGAAVYIAAQEWCDALSRRRIWTQDAFSTAIALSVLGFIYFWWRNTGDFALLILSIGLMMASLMIAIALLAAFGTAFKEQSVKPLAGLLWTFFGAFALGVLGGVLALFLGGAAGLVPKLAVVGIGLFGWKIRESLRPPLANTHAQGSDALPVTQPATHSLRWALIPRGGTLLDRFVPVLVLATIAFFSLRQSGTSNQLWSPAPPVAAQPDNANPAAEREPAAP